MESAFYLQSLTHWSSETTGTAAQISLAFECWSMAYAKGLDCCRNFPCVGGELWSTCSHSSGKKKKSLCHFLIHIPLLFFSLHVFSKQNPCHCFWVSAPNSLFGDLLHCCNRLSQFIAYSEQVGFQRGTWGTAGRGISHSLLRCSNWHLVKKTGNKQSDEGIWEILTGAMWQSQSPSLLTSGSCNRRGRSEEWGASGYWWCLRTPISNLPDRALPSTPSWWQRWWTALGLCLQWLLNGLWAIQLP